MKHLGRISEFACQGDFSDEVKKYLKLPLRQLQQRAKGGQKLERPKPDCRNNKRRGADFLKIAAIVPLLLMLVFFEESSTDDL